MSDEFIQYSDSQVRKGLISNSSSHPSPPNPNRERRTFKTLKNPRTAKNKRYLEVKTSSKSPEKRRKIRNKVKKRRRTHLKPMKSKKTNISLPIITKSSQHISVNKSELSNETDLSQIHNPSPQNLHYRSRNLSNSYQARSKGYKNRYQPSNQSQEAHKKNKKNELLNKVRTKLIKQQVMERSFRTGIKFSPNPWSTMNTNSVSASKHQF